MNKYISRVTSSARGEVFNPLLWPFLIATFAYGVGFAFTLGVVDSSLYLSLAALTPALPVAWGILALMVIVGGLTFLLFNLPPYGKLSGLFGFMLWTTAAFAYGFSGSWLLFFAVAIPNMWFWFWQYLSLSVFRRQEELDRQTMSDYDTGKYDDELNPKDSKIDREHNRGQDIQP